ncbi:hypothetical protein IPZ60_03790 [Psychrobacter sp. NG25]|uniref:hypothetical protein n=1 Tax=Psychrobacter TaxID=497 RepID=UPI001883EEA1|nr:MULTISPECIES: hypothetical protein [Psychrobacter]MBF0657856.1 hypothetical protein [Psychrobacter sp. NG25]
MSSLVNYDKNISIQLAPVSYNEFGVMCSLEVKAELICLDFKNVNEVNRYMSYENITYLKKQLTKLDNLDQFEDEDELVFSIYPIDMFFTMDIFKSNDYLLFIKLRVPVGVYTNGKITGYDFGLDFSVRASAFKLFLEDFLNECQEISIS